MNAADIVDAVGLGHGASLVLQTGRARVEIVRHEPDNRRAFYTVQGDVPLEERNAARLPMTPTAAHALAFRCLAAYNGG